MRWLYPRRFGRPDVMEIVVVVMIIGGLVLMLIR